MLKIERITKIGSESMINWPTNMYKIDLNVDDYGQSSLLMFRLFKKIKNNPKMNLINPANCNNIVYLLNFIFCYSFESPNSLFFFRIVDITIQRVILHMTESSK